MLIDPRTLDQRMRDSLSKLSLIERTDNRIRLMARQHRDAIVWENHQMLRALVELEWRKDPASIINIKFRIPE